MENLTLKRQTLDEGRVISLELTGSLILSNGQKLKEEFVAVIPLLGNHVKFTIVEPEEIDLSCIQLIVAFRNQLDELKIKYEFEWLIEEEQRLLLEHVGLIDELFLTN